MIYIAFLLHSPLIPYSSSYLWRHFFYILLFFSFLSYVAPLFVRAELRSLSRAQKTTQLSFPLSLTLSLSYSSSFGWKSRPKGGKRKGKENGRRQEKYSRGKKERKKEEEEEGSDEKGEIAAVQLDCLLIEFRSVSFQRKKEENYQTSAANRRC